MTHGSYSCSPFPCLELQFATNMPNGVLDSYQLTKWSLPKGLRRGLSSAPQASTAGVWVSVEQTQMRTEHALFNAQRPVWAAPSGPGWAAQVKGCGPVTPCTLELLGARKELMRSEQTLIGCNRPRPRSAARMRLGARCVGSREWTPGPERSTARAAAPRKCRAASGKRRAAPAAGRGARVHCGAGWDPTVSLPARAARRFCTRRSSRWTVPMARRAAGAQGFFFIERILTVRATLRQQVAACRPLWHRPAPPLCTTRLRPPCYLGPWSGLSGRYGWTPTAKHLIWVEHGLAGA